MNEKLLTLEDMQKFIGTEAKPHVLHVEKELVRHFVEAVQDLNPLWTDEEYAKTTRHGGTIVPPHLFCACMTLSRCSPESGVISMPVPEAPLPRDNTLEGEETWEFFAPMRVGDIVTSRTKLTDVKKREGRLGEMFILVYEAESTNQRGELVARTVNTIINY